MKPLNKVKIKWSCQFAYAIGLIVADGNLSKDGRHINFTSKDRQLINIFNKSLDIENIVKVKYRDKKRKRKYYFVAFSDVVFYNFLLSIGVYPNKSKIIEKIDIPKKLFFHFLRGVFDGDGNISEYIHSESKHIQLKIRFFSGSTNFLRWLYNINKFKNIKGYFTFGARVDILAYAKKNSIQLINLMYDNSKGYRLERKFKIAKKYYAGMA